MSLAEAALGLARGGWFVFPCHSVAADGFCTCGKPGCENVAKHPRWAKGHLERGLKDATADPAQVMGWWSTWPDANIGLPMGDGVFGLDLDGEAAQETLWLLPELPESLSVVTGNGRHLYLRVPDGVEVRNKAKKFTDPGPHFARGIPRDREGRLLLPGIDIRGDGGYLLAPPSVHASGHVYAWECQDAEIADAPDWLVELVMQRPEPERQTVTPVVRAPGEVTPYAQAALTAELERLARAREGERNTTLNEVVFSLGTLVAGGELPESLVVDEAWAIGRAIGLSERGTWATIRSAMGASARSPRVAPEPRTRHRDPQKSPGITENERSADKIIAATFAPKHETSTNGTRPHVEYPLGVWPGPIAELIAETARAVCVEPAAVGTAVLAVAAGAIGRARWLDVKGEGGWIERPGIYAGLVGEVSRRKSPVLETVAEPLERMHGEAAARWLRDQEDYEQGGSKGKEPELSSLLLKDVTTEVLAHALQAHPRGVTLVADELVGWLNGMGQYKGGKGNDRQRWLEAHKARTIDVRRVGRKPIVVEHPCVGILGGVQPEVFSGLTSVRDGLAERFLYCVMPKVALDASTPDVSRRARATWESIVRALYALTEAEIVCEVPGCLTEARQRALDLHAAAPAVLEGYLGKGEMHLARIGIVLATVWEVCGGGDRSLTAGGVGRAEDLWGFYAEQGASLFSGDVVPVRSYEFASPATERELVVWIRAQGGCSTKREAMNSGPLRGLSAKEADVVIYTAAARGRLGAAPGERRDSLVLTVSDE